MYGLNLARGLGDKFLKEEDLGFSAEPYVSPLWRVPRKEARILLIASDGLWDVADYPEIVALARRAYRCDCEGPSCVALRSQIVCLFCSLSSCMHLRSIDHKVPPTSRSCALHLALFYLFSRSHQFSFLCRDSGGDALDVAKVVLERALERRTKDDVTVVAACFSPLDASAGPPMEAGSFSLMTA